MCGFVGCYPQDDSDQIRFCLEQISHRGPDARHVMDTPHGTLGHARLAILDVASGHQPMRSGGDWIVFNGEIYNFQDLRARIGGEYRTDSDTETVLHLFQEQGPAGLQELDGMFAIAITAADGLFLARDPLGIKPLYYSRDEGRTYFASEVKALLPVGGRIEEFPAGHWWHPRDGLQPFFDFDDYRSAAPDPGREPGEADYERIRATLRQAVYKRLIADPDVPVGVSLSGGLDSSIIAALAREIKDPLDTFVVGMSGSPDIARSQEVADHLGTRHHVLTYDLDDMIAVLPDVITHLESFDAALIRSAIPNFFLARLASAHVKVILTGEGADELFGGYEYLRGVQDPGRLHAETWTITNNLHNTNLQRTDRMTMAHGLEGRVPFLDQAMVDLAFRLPPAWKLTRRGRPEKALLRTAFAGMLPANILRRPKQKFSAGAGSMHLLVEHARARISEAEYRRVRRQHPDLGLRSREELFYYRMFREIFGERFPARVIGRTRSVTPTEIQ